MNMDKTMTAQDRIERAEKELAEAKKMLAKDKQCLTFGDLAVGEFYDYPPYMGSRTVIRVKMSHNQFAHIDTLGNQEIYDTKPARPVRRVRLRGVDCEYIDDGTL